MFEFARAQGIYDLPRNPYDRIFSAYKSKIGNVKAEEWYQRVQRAIREYCDYPERVGVVAFRDFVRYVQSEHDGDPHWVSLTKRLALDLMPYDFIGRHETFARDFETVMAKLGAPDDVRAFGSTPYGKSYEIPLAVAYDKEIADSVYELYREDFERFGYDRESWRFLGVET